MAFTTGTATDFHDLLDDLRTYLVAQGWTQLAWDAPAGITDTAKLVVQGPGAGAGQEVYAWIETQTDAVNGYYTWSLRMMTDYDGAQPEDNQENVSPTRRYASLHGSTIDYWFYVSDRRAIVVAKCGSVYVSFYLGFFLPWGLPDEYPFPIYIGGCGKSNYSVSEGNSSFRFFADPGTGTTYLLSADYEWLDVINHADSSDINHPVAGGGGGITVFPYHLGTAANGVSGLGYWTANTGGYTSGHGLDAMRATPQGERPLMPIELIQDSFNGELGALDGVYCVPGNGLVSEQVITIGADDYRVFQNVFRSSGNDFIAIKEA